MKFNDVLDSYQGDLAKVDDIIKLHCKGKSDLVEEIAKYITSSGGKKIRPILVAICAKLTDPDSKDYHNLCAATELIHTATLLHDDVIDNSELRRGKKTANSIWDNKASILVGDFLFSLAFQLMVKTKSIYILDILSRASNLIADGEVNQLENSNDLSISIEKYLEIIEGKTSVLFASACSSGAAIAKATKEQEFALYQYGNNLGLLFQIIDDIIDYTSNTSELGKAAGDDFFESKVTLPIILCYRDAKEQDRQKIEELFAKSYDGKATQQDLEQILEILNSYDSFGKSFEYAKVYHQKALESLKAIQDSLEKQHLVEIVNFALNRTK